MNLFSKATILLGCLAMISCSESYRFEQDFSIDNNEWKIANTANFKYTVSENSAPADINIAIDHSNEYYYGNIYLFTSIQFPSGKTISDTLQYILVDRNSEWTGKGSTSKKGVFPYKRAVTFPETGEYTFSIQHAMRVGKDSVLRGINSIGLKIK